MRQAIDGLLREAADSGAVPGVVAMAADRSGVRYQGAFGRRALPDGPAMTLDSLFWVASMTKAITAVAAMQLVEQGRMALDQPAGSLVPELAAPMLLTGFDTAGEPLLRPARETITLRHLLTHTAGFAYDSWNADVGRYVALRDVPSTSSGRLAALGVPLVAEPGTRWEYSIAIDWVGRIVEAVSEMELGAYFDARILAPLGMRDTGYHLRPGQAARLAVLHRRAPDGSLEAVVREPPSLPEFKPGGGGLHSTAEDYLTFLRMLLHGGTLGNAAILRPETVALMGQNHIGALPGAGVLRSANRLMSHDFAPLGNLPSSWGLSFLINEADLPGRRRAGSLAWGGMANSYYWLDRASGRTGVLLTQILPFADPAVLRLFEGFETEVYRE